MDQTWPVVRFPRGPKSLRFTLASALLGMAGCAQLQLPQMQWAWPRFSGDSSADVAMEPATGSRDVDPRQGIKLRVSGSGVRFDKVEVRDGDGKPVAGVSNGGEYLVKPPLQFGTRYQVRATALSAMGEPVTREFQLTTVAVPQLGGASVRPIGPDGVVTLSFDRPVGRLEIAGNLDARVEPDGARRSFRVVASRYAKGGMTPVEVRWETPGGVPLPPLALQFTSAPPLKTELSLQGQTNLGLALPLELRFGEKLAERDKLTDVLLVQTEAGVPVSGRWQWIAEQRLRFKPEPLWPAASTIQVRAEPGRIRSASGATNTDALLGSFQTGADRKIVVYLDSQRLAAIENGQVVKTIKVSTGKPATPTVTGSYYIYARYPRKTMRSQARPGEPGHYVVENVPYAQYFHADYALHGAWWHNGFGRPASHGCVNVPTRTNNRRWPKAPEEAGWLYDWAALGVPVTVQRSASR